MMPDDLPVKVRVLYFAGLRERVGVSRTDETMPPGTTVGELWDSIRARSGRIDETVRPGFAVNGEWSDRTRVLTDGDEVGLLPPVSGG